MKNRTVTGNILKAQGTGLGSDSGWCPDSGLDSNSGFGSDKLGL